MIVEIETIEQLNMDEAVILQKINEYKVLTMEQFIDILLNGESRRGYYMIEKLKNKRLIRAERVPGDPKRKYIVLTKKGAELIKEDVKLHEYYVRKETVDEILDTNEIYRILKNTGVDEIKGRKEALDELDIKPYQSALKWMFKQDGNYAVYIRKRGNKNFIKKSLIGTGSKITGHIIIYDNTEYQRKDRKDWLMFMSVEKLYQTTLSDFSNLIESIKHPSVYLAEFTEKIKKYVSSGEIVKVEECPLPLAWEKNGIRMLLCDLTTGNIAGPALMLPYSSQQIKELGWGEGIIYYVKDVKAARMWARLLKWQKCNYFITKEETGLYSIKEGKLIKLK
jgi:DNA-binding PadR family transcriptional regulator